MESDKVIGDYRELIETVRDLLDILAKIGARITAIIATELTEIKSSLATPARARSCATRGNPRLTPDQAAGYGRHADPRRLLQGAAG